jgi:hypothetical protein
MARKPKTENEIVVSTGAAVPARRKTTTARPRRAATAPKHTKPEAVPTVAAAPVEPELVAPSVVPSREEIAALAYSYWEGRGCQGGCPEEDWLRAEQELRTRRPAANVATA